MRLDRGTPWAGFLASVRCCDHWIASLGLVSQPRGHCATKDAVSYSLKNCKTIACSYPDYFNPGSNLRFALKLARDGKYCSPLFRIMDHVYGDATLGSNRLDILMDIQIQG